MPRHSSRSTVQPPPQPQPALPDNLLTLRRQWKWAAFSQFFFTFAQLFPSNDITLLDIENDLVYSTAVVIPRIMQRLLYTLSYDRKVTVDNWQTALRKQYFKRDPDANPIGSQPPQQPSLHLEDSRQPSVRAESQGQEDENGAMGEAAPDLADGSQDAPDQSRRTSPGTSMPPNIDANAEEPPKDWLELPMLTKLGSLHLLTEWQFHNPTRLRTLMKSDDENAEWRAEPIGYDAKRNAYWLIGDDRLWIQRAIPKPNLKRKRSEVKPRAKAKAKQPSKRARVDPAPTTRQSRPTRSTTDASPSGRGAGRAAKAQANEKLNAQAKELAELTKQAAKQHPSRNLKPTRQSSRTSTAPSLSATATTRRSFGTRVSARLRGSSHDEWQKVPDEWLVENGASQKKALKTGLESDVESISDLTELSDDDDKEDLPEHATVAHHHSPSPEMTKPTEEPEEPLVPADFVEWETISVTLEEWEHVADRFTQATHYAEKALYKTLAEFLVPVITEKLKEIERNRRLEEALVHRKRSSRIAIRQSEKEEALLTARKRAEEDEKQSRAKRLEARLQKEEADRVKRETAREQRRKDREAREAKQEQESLNSEEPLAANTPELAPPPETSSGQQRKRSRMNGSHSTGRASPKDSWELDCEICHRKGQNLDDGYPMLCCGSCSKWQHIACHDAANYRAGRPPRNWEVEEFQCERCRMNPGMSKQAMPQQAHRPIPSSANVHPSLQHSVYARSPVNGHNNHGPIQLQPAPGMVYQPPVLSLSPQVPYSSHGPISFAHYQPQQRDFVAAPVHQPYAGAQVQSYQGNLLDPRVYVAPHYNTQLQQPQWNAAAQQLNQRPIPLNGSIGLSNGTPMAYSDNASQGRAPMDSQSTPRWPATSLSQPPNPPITNNARN
ncbi:hypothetical protein HGRIS_003666 [Hohenbuehelia grisea]|uniref:Zinc finger PHD-type domain-containing protein n=1 Tax=Hohenbuehelia grisea TaxID=104357 RepID=A0ABR3JGQ8_9AGAR